MCHFYSVFKDLSPISTDYGTVTNFRNVLSLTIVFTLLLALISSCAPREAEETVEEITPEEVVKEETVEEEIAPEELRRAYEGTTLNVLLKVGYETAAIENFVGDFEEATGIKVNYEVYDEPTLRDKFILDASSQAGAYDVTAVQFWYFPEYDRAGWLEPLDSYIQQKKDPEWLDVNEIPESVRRAFTGKDGSLYAIPVSSAGGILIYRTDILEKHGLEVPSTTGEVMELAKKLKELEPDLYPFVGRGDSSFASFPTSAGWAWAYGGRVLDDELQVTVNSPEMKDGITDIVSLMKDYGPPDQAAIGWDKMSELYRKGTAVMNFEMSGFPSVYANPEISDVAGKIGIALIKGPADNYAQWFYSEALAISKYSKNKEAAWLFLQWRSSLDVYEKEVKEHIRFDMPYDAIADTDVYKEESEKLGVGFYTEKLPEINAAVNMAYWPSVPEFVPVAEAFQKEISLAIAGTQTVDEALNKAQKEIERIMEEAGY